MEEPGQLDGRGAARARAPPLVGDVALRPLQNPRPPPPPSGTALYAAAHQGHLRAAEELVAAGADVNLADGVSGQTPLYWAARKGRLDIVKLLLAANADKVGARARVPRARACPSLSLSLSPERAVATDALAAERAKNNHRKAKADFKGEKPIDVVLFGPDERDRDAIAAALR